MKRIVIILAIIIVLCVSCKKKPEGRPYAKFEGGLRDVHVPDGWTKVDPYTTATPHWSEQWYPVYMPKDNKVCYVYSPSIKQFQFFYAIGLTDSLQPDLYKNIPQYNNHPLISWIEPWKYETDDGIEVKGYATRMEPGALAGDDVVYVVGYAEIGDSLFIINGGGKTHNWDKQLVEDAITRLNLGH